MALRFAHAATGAGAGAVTAMATLFAIRRMRLILGCILASQHISDILVLCVGILRYRIMLRLAVTMLLMARRFIRTNLSIFSIRALCNPIHRCIIRILLSVALAVAAIVTSFCSASLRFFAGHATTRIAHHAFGSFLLHPPLLGIFLSHDGNMAKSVNGNASAMAKPNIPMAGPA